MKLRVLVRSPLRIYGVFAASALSSIVQFKRFGRADIHRRNMTIIVGIRFVPASISYTTVVGRTSVEFDSGPSRLQSGQPSNRTFEIRSHQSFRRSRTKLYTGKTRNYVTATFGFRFDDKRSASRLVLQRYARNAIDVERMLTSIPVVRWCVQQLQHTSPIKF